MAESKEKAPKALKKKKTKPKSKSWVKRIILILATALLAIIVVGGTAAGILVVKAYRELPEFSEIEQDDKSILYDNENSKIVEIRGTENRQIVDYDDLPQALIDAVIATEDTRFYEHSGIDLVRIGGALIADLKSGSSSQGASTLTMQLARNAILDSQEKILDRKIKEALLALQIERQYSKDEILTMYLNEVYLGEGAYGVQMAAIRYFSKDVSELNISECAMIVGILKAPEPLSPLNNLEGATYARNVTLDNMVRNGSLDEAKAEAVKNSSLSSIPRISKSRWKVIPGSPIMQSPKPMKSWWNWATATEKFIPAGSVSTQRWIQPPRMPRMKPMPTAAYSSGVGDDLLQSAAVFIDPDTGERSKP